MPKTNGLRAKIGILSSFFVASLFICGLPIFVMQAVSLYHATHGSAGALESYQNIPQIIISFIVFSYITKIGYKKSLILIAFIMTIACLAMPYLDHYWAIKVFLMLAGAAFVCTKITVYSATALVTSSKKGHVSFLSIMEGIFMFGTMFGMWVFSEFMKGNWIYAFWIFACLSALSGLYWLITPLNESAIAEAKTETFRESMAGMKKLVKQYHILFYMFMIAVYAMIEVGVFSWLPTYNNVILSLPKAVSIELGSLMIAFIAIGRILFGVVLKYVKWQTVFIVNFICGIILITITAISLHNGVNTAGVQTIFQAPLVAFSLPLLGFFIAPVIPTLNSTILTSVPKLHHTAMISIMVIISSLASSFASRLVGGMFTWFGGQLAFDATTLIPLVILLLIILPYTKVLFRAEKKLKESEV